MTPIVSIVIPCYNHGKYIQEALDSINHSKDKYSVEIIIVNDGSTDLFTINELKRIESEGYFVLNQINGGLGNARNNGIKIAKGKYILPLDSDNKVEKPYLNEAIDFLEANENIDIVYGDAQQFGDKTTIWKLSDYNLQHLMLSNFIDACAVYKKSVWMVNNGYDEKMPIMGYEDWDFWLNSSFNNFNFYHLKQICFHYRVVQDSMIRTISGKDKETVDKYLNFKYNNYLNYQFCQKHVFRNLKYGKEERELYIKTMSYRILIKFIVFKIIFDLKKIIKK